MVEVIQLHPYKQSYPFGLQKQSECTYVQLLKQLTSQTELQTYKQNLTLFKSLESDLVIPLDSYVKENNTLQLYYEYEPLSIKHYIEERLMMMAEDQVRDKFLTKIITCINVAIEDVITLMMCRKIMALLSIENMAIGKGEKIKFFIEPDFQYVEKPTPNQLTQYYNTQKKKLQIQLQQFLQHIFSFTNTKPKDHSKANFVIQGTKLVFVNEQQTNRQSSMSGVSVLPTGGNVTNASSIIGSNTVGNGGNTTVHQIKNEIKLPAYMLKDPKEVKQTQEQVNINNSSKQKFDIKNILDEKKLQKNQPHFPSKQHSAKPHPQQSTLDRSPTKNSFTETTDEPTKNNQKDVKNYFENNDDFNKDASFYPEQFIKEDSIAEFEGYEDQLEKQLQDLKKKKYDAQQLANTSKNRLSMVPNTPINPQLGDQKMSKSPSPQQGQSTKPNKNTNQFPQNVLNSSDSRQNDTSQEQQRQKKKYKVTITTSHLVDVDDQNADLRTIEQQLIQDIKKGTIKHNPQGSGVENKQQQQAGTQLSKGNSEKQQINSPNLPAQLLKGHSQIPHTPQDSQLPHQAPSTHKPTSSSSLIQEHTAQQRPFSKQQHPHMSSQTTTYSSQMGNTKEQMQQYNSGAFIHGGSTTTSNQQAPDIKKIIEKIKNNSQNHQFITSTNMTQGPTVSSQNPSVVKPMTHTHPETSYQGQKTVQQQESRPYSQLSSQVTPVSSNINQTAQKKEQEKEYYDKIQKAKMKAEEIMKLVKERKGQ